MHGMLGLWAVVANSPPTPPCISPPHVTAYIPPRGTEYSVWWLLHYSTLLGGEFSCIPGWDYLIWIWFAAENRLDQPFSLPFPAVKLLPTTRKQDIYSLSEVSPNCYRPMLPTHVAHTQNQQTGWQSANYPCCTDPNDQKETKSKSDRLGRPGLWLSNARLNSTPSCHPTLQAPTILTVTPKTSFPSVAFIS